MSETEEALEWINIQIDNGKLLGLKHISAYETIRTTLQRQAEIEKHKGNDIELLNQHNKWRRGDEDIPMIKPKVLGEVIDSVLVKVSLYTEIESLLQNLKTVDNHVELIDVALQIQKMMEK